MALIKKEILISREVVYTKSCTRNQNLFCKKDAFQNTDFSRLKCTLKLKKNCAAYLLRISKFEPTREWVLIK